MAGRARLTTQEKLGKLASEIKSREEELDSLKAQYKELSQKLEEEELKKIRDIIRKSGKSIEDVEKILVG